MKLVTCVFLFTVLFLLQSTNAIYLLTTLKGYNLGRYGLLGRGVYDTAYYGRGYLPPPPFPLKT